MIMRVILTKPFSKVNYIHAVQDMGMATFAVTSLAVQYLVHSSDIARDVINFSTAWHGKYVTSLAMRAQLKEQNKI